MADCSIDGCARKRKYKKTGWCQTHYHRWWRTGRVNGLKQERGARGESSRCWKGDNITYRTAHKRVQNMFGKASDGPCAGCGKQADHWAYDGEDPNEKWEYFDSWEVEIPYSTDVSHYKALCRSCHVKQDRYKQNVYRC